MSKNITNKIAIIAILLISFFGMNLEEGKGQCPTGFTPTSVTINIHGCDYIVDLCYRCSIMGGIPGTVQTIGFMRVPTSPPCIPSPAISAQQALQFIETYVQSAAFYNTYLCTPTITVPPCPAQSRQLEYFYHNCWKAELISYFGVESLYYHVCEPEVYCHEVYTLCYDAPNNTNRKTVVSLTQVGTPSCTLSPAEVTMPTVVGQFSECFKLVTPCD